MNKTEVYIEKYATARQKTIAEAEQDLIVKEVKEHYAKTEPENEDGGVK